MAPVENQTLYPSALETCVPGLLLFSTEQSKTSHLLNKSDLPGNSSTRETNPVPAIGLYVWNIFQSVNPSFCLCAIWVQPSLLHLKKRNGLLYCCYQIIWCGAVFNSYIWGKYFKRLNPSFCGEMSLNNVLCIYIYIQNSNKPLWFTANILQSILQRKLYSC